MELECGVDQSKVQSKISIIKNYHQLSDFKHYVSRDFRAVTAELNITPSQRSMTGQMCLHVDWSLFNLAGHFDQPHFSRPPTLIPDEVPLLETSNLVLSLK